MTTIIGIECLELPGNSRYAISACGRVFSRRARNPNSRRAISRDLWNQWIELKPWVHPSGHLYVSIGGKNHQVHRLVLAAFRRPGIENEECRHLDGNPQNNNLNNLAWGTKSDNCADKRRHGTDNAGVRHYNAKLTARQVAAMRSLRERHPGKSGIVSFLSRWFRVSQPQASNACNGVSYGNNSWD